MKTGSTSIHQFLIEAHDALLEDGYENYPKGQGRPFVKCLLPRNNRSKTRWDNKKNYCMEETVAHAKRIASSNLKFITSDENLGNVGMRLTNFSTFLHNHWSPVKIVVYYRRFYDMMMSLYGFKHRKKYYPFPDANNDDAIMDSMRYIPSKAEFFNITNIQLVWDQKGTSKLIAHYKKFFGNNDDSIHVVNIHDGSDSVEKFFCHAIPDADRACKLYKSGNDSIRRNVRTSLEYGNLAFAARQMGMVNNNITSTDLNTLEDSIRNHQENNLNRTVYDFPKQCLPRATLMFLLEQTLENEKAVFPEFFKSPLGEESLRSDFWKQAKTTLCDVDLEATLAMTEWQDFFELYKQK